MFDAAVTVTKSDADFYALPIVHESRSSRMSAVLQLVWLIPALAGLALPFSLIVAERTAVTAIVAANPLAALNLVIGLALWTALFGWPVTKLLARFGAQHSVRIAQGTVTVRERRLLGSSLASTPLNSYAGVVHMVRTTLSGVRHELVLVDAKARSKVVFYSAERIGPETVERAARALDLPVIAASDVVRFGRALSKPAVPIKSAHAELVLDGLPQAA